MSNAERDIADDIKEKLGYVSSNPDTEEEELESTTISNEAAAAAAAGSRGGGSSNSSSHHRDDEEMYELPDGNVIRCGAELYSCAEVLFQGLVEGRETRGLQDILYETIQCGDIDIRRDLYANIVLSGGATTMRGMETRLHCELRALAPASMRVNVVAPAHREYLAWMGGSILASLSSFQAMWVTAEEYKEHGASIINRKCYQ